jgi:hypothetical protein
VRLPALGGPAALGRCACRLAAGLVRLAFRHDVAT